MSLLLTFNADAKRLADLLSGHAECIVSIADEEWERLIALARKCGVAQMLYTALSAQCALLPFWVADMIRSIHLASAVHSIKLFYQLEKILQAFNDAAIPVVPLKGVWLGDVVYGNIAVRGMSDMDLWVRRSDIEEACRVMELLGYSLGAPNEQRPMALQDELLGERQFFKSGVPMVELHWRLFPGEWLRHTARIDEESIWQRTLPYKGESVRQLAAEDAIIHIGVHLAVNHQMSMMGFRALLDLECAARKLGIDWDVMARRARSWKVATPMWLVLLMQEQLFGDPEKNLPLAMLEPSQLQRWLLSRLVLPQYILDDVEISGVKKYFLLLSMVDKPADALLLLWRALVPDEKWLMLRYGLQGASTWRIWLQRARHVMLLLLKREI